MGYSGAPQDFTTVEEGFGRGVFTRWSRQNSKASDPLFISFPRWVDGQLEPSLLDAVVSINTPILLQATTTSMPSLRDTLSNLVRNLSEESYDESLAQCRFFLDIGTAHGYVSQDQVEKDILLIMQSELLRSGHGELIHPAAHLFSRFVGDMRVDRQFPGTFRDSSEAAR